ncbi:DUF4845 domain-containing protein [Rubrivivax gelatinosus]|nr:DUF4845 domain-containing protein [Rubrivivax gelatinosus]
MIPVPRQPRANQRGITLFGLLSWAVVLGFTGYVLVRAVPTVNEYLTIKRAIAKVAAAQPSTVAEARGAFDRQKEVEYAITSIDSKDLEITKENDKVVISFAYDKEIPLAGPVYLLLKYEGSAKAP